MGVKKDKVIRSQKRQVHGWGTKVDTPCFQKTHLRFPVLSEGLGTFNLTSFTLPAQLQLYKLLTGDGSRTGVMDLAQA